MPAERTPVVINIKSLKRRKNFALLLEEFLATEIICHKTIYCKTRIVKTE